MAESGEAHSYDYDDANRVIQHGTWLESVTTGYSYDSAGQLTGADYTGGGISDESYEYDDNGNRESASSQSYVVGAFNRLLSDGVYEYGYDNEGNLIHRWKTNDPGQQTYYTWDHRNRLVHVSGWSGEHEALIVDYAYDAYNQLVYKRSDKPFEEGESSTVFVHDNGQVVLEFDKAGCGSLDAADLAHRYLWGPAVDQLLADEHVNDLFDAEANETLWALADLLGSVRDMVDNNGTVRLHRVFDSFGNLVDETHYNASGTEVIEGQAGYLDEAFAFTGRYLDRDTGLQNNLNRWYDPSTGRWMSEDPISFAAGDANLYRYVGNSPTNFIDPSGLAKKAGVIGGGDFIIITRDGAKYGGRTGNDLIDAWVSIRDAGQTIDWMIIKGHGGDGDPSTKDDGPWMQGSDGFTLIGVARWRIIADNKNGYCKDLTDILKDITDPKSSISLRGCSTSTLGGVVAGTTQSEVTANPTPVVNIPWTWWYIGPWTSL